MLQLELAKEQGLPEKQREILWRISDCYDKAGYLDIAENHLKELLEQELSEEQKLEALCFLADIQVGPGAFSERPFYASTLSPIRSDDGRQGLTACSFTCEK
jgi:hypothetical protein